MTSVYLILAHKGFDQVIRLVRRLLIGDTAVILHVDSTVTPPRDILEQCDEKKTGRVRLADQRLFAAWGSYEAVLAGLSLLQEGIKYFPQARYYSLLSGQDYPIKSPEYIDQFFSNNSNSFVLHIPLLQERWKYGGVRRINRFYWAKNRKSLPGFFFRTIPLPPYPTRFFPIPVEKIFYGSQWWSMEGNTARQLLSFVSEHPKVLKAFRWSYVPDEMFFATALVGMMQTKAVISDNLRYIEHFSLPRDWLRLKVLNRNGIRELDVPDLEKIQRSSALFARKFDMVKNPDVLDRLDELCGNRS